ncbi:MAG: hypothetical protein K9K38_11575 [Rhodoferax sp.]|nr:hypothetical protein [Rhodoferax sp.]MCF8210024.1 hypothetical protein [Rhodoferax sp.]
MDQSIASQFGNQPTGAMDATLGINAIFWLGVNYLALQIRVVKRVRLKVMWNLIPSPQRGEG